MAQAWIFEKSDGLSSCDGCRVLFTSGDVVVTVGNHYLCATCYQRNKLGVDDKLRKRISSS